MVGFYYTANIYCPTGKALFGGGGFLDGPPEVISRVSIVRIYPGSIGPGLNLWVVVAWVHTPLLPDTHFTLQAHAVCAS